jgi:hypothetical protein
MAFPVEKGTLEQIIHIPLTLAVLLFPQEQLSLQAQQINDPFTIYV